MEHTKNYNLRKPEGTDYINVEDFNENAEIIDREMEKVDSELEVARTSGVTGENHDSISGLINKIESRQTINNLDTKERFVFSLEVKDGQPRIKLEEI